MGELKAKVNESADHFAYRKIAIDILKDKGFDPFREIYHDYDVEYPVDGRVKYQVDVVGIKENYKIAIECGTVELSKVMNLRRIFNEVIIVNAQKVAELYEYWRERHYIETEQLTGKVNELVRINEHIVHDANAKVGPLADKIDELEHEVKRLNEKVRYYQRVLAKAWEEVKKEQS